MKRRAETRPWKVQESQNEGTGILTQGPYAAGRDYSCYAHFLAVESEA